MTTTSRRVLEARAATVVAATAVAGVLWAAVAAPGGAPQVRSGDGWTTVGLPATLLTAAGAAAAGMLLLTVLERRVARARRVWTVAATAVLVLSFAGPPAGRTLADVTALAALHLGVGLTVLAAGRRTARVRGGDRAGTWAGGRPRPRLGAGARGGRPDER